MRVVASIFCSGVAVENGTETLDALVAEIVAGVSGRSLE